MDWSDISFCFMFSAIIVGCCYGIFRIATVKLFYFPKQSHLPLQLGRLAIILLLAAMVPAVFANFFDPDFYKDGTIDMFIPSRYSDGTESVRIGLVHFLMTLPVTAICFLIYDRLKRNKSGDKDT